MSITALVERMLNKDLEVDPSQLQLIKESLINCRQHEAFLRIILVCYNRFFIKYLITG